MKKCLFAEIVLCLFLLVVSFACRSNDTANPFNDGNELPNVPHEPEPPPPDRVMTDEPFLQEYNHTLNEQPEEIGELVSLIMPPQAYSDFDRPTLVGPRGLWLRDTPDSLRLLEMLKKLPTSSMRKRLTAPSIS